MHFVRDQMTAAPQTARMDEVIGSLAERMVSRRIRHLPVVDAEGVLVGMVTDFVVFQRGTLAVGEWFPWHEDDASTAASALCVPIDVIARRDDPLGTTLTRLSATPQDAVVVVDEVGRPEGIITEHDIVRLGADLLDNIALFVRTQGLPVVVEHDTTGAEAFDLMVKHSCRHVVVGGTNPIGVLSFRDLVRENVTRGREVTAEELVRGQQLHWAGEGISLKEAAAVMAKHKIGCVPVLDLARHVVGMVTRTDVGHGVVDVLAR
jgi:CBS domain-containing protein